MVFINSLQSISGIIIMVATGYVLSLIGVLNKAAAQTFTVLILNISLPCLMFAYIIENFNANLLKNFGGNLYIPALSILVGFLISIPVSGIAKIKENRLGTFRSMFFLSNSIFVGLPVNMALYGKQSIPYVLMYYICNTSFFWTLGVFMISKDGISKENIFSRDMYSKYKYFIKRIITPPLMGFVIALLFVFLNIHIPKVIMDTCKYFGNLTTPLSMLFLGILIFSVKKKDIKVDFSMIFLLTGRFVVSPLIIIFLTMLFPVPDLMKKVFVIQAAMPAMTNTSIIAAEYGADAEYAAVSTMITTLVSIVVIPIYASII